SGLARDLRPGRHARPREHRRADRAARAGVERRGGARAGPARARPGAGPPRLRHHARPPGAADHFRPGRLPRSRGRLPGRAGGTRDGRRPGARPGAAHRLRVARRAGVRLPELRRELPPRVLRSALDPVRLQPALPGRGPAPGRRGRTERGGPRPRRVVLPLEAAGALVAGVAAVFPGERLFRARRISTTFGRVYLGAKANQFIARRLRPPGMPRRSAAFHKSSARQIHGLALELRGLILKGCQFVGARADVVPGEYVEVLSRLQDRVPAKTLGVVRRTIERELGRPLGDVFAEFAPRPIAAASLAQVHEARLHDGRRVAVKVQYPEIADQVRGDLANLRALFRAVGWLERELDLLPIVDELAAQMPRELDFEREGRNAEELAALLGHPRA